MRSQADTDKAVEALTEAVRAYHATLDPGEDTAVGSVPMNWVLVYSASAIDEDDSIIWGNHSVNSKGDPNAHSGLVMWAAEVVGASTEEY